MTDYILRICVDAVIHACPNLITDASGISVHYIEGILPKGPYLPCLSMAGRALLAGYHRYILFSNIVNYQFYNITYFEDGS